MAMKKFVRRFSSTSLEVPYGGKQLKGARERSISELYEPSQVARSPRAGLEYLGYTYIDDPKSPREIQSAIRTVKQTSVTHNHWVSILLKSGTITVTETTGETLITSSVASIAQCMSELNRGFGDCLAITFSAGHNAKQCHVFQAKSSKEAADMVQQVQKAHRSSSKSRSRGHSEMAISFSKPQQKGGSPKVGMHLMEDEEEVIEHKPISQPLSRNESKRIITRTSWETSPLTDSVPPLSRFSSHPPVSPWFMTTPPKRHRRKGKFSEKEFTVQDKKTQLLNAVDRVLENNGQLRQMACSKTTPSSPFEDALYAIQVQNFDLLRNYIRSGHVHIESCDSSGNTLLHYATALGRVEAVKVLCSFPSQALIDAKGWNECTASHRAVVESNISILRVLLSQNANINMADLMRRTPLHMSAGKKELMECSIALLEAGAQIMATDVLGMRPHDIDPELKETQSRLVISACELFSSSAPKDHAPSTPTTSSPLSTRPSSITSELTRSHDDHMRLHYGSTRSRDFMRPHPLRQHRYPSPDTVAEANARITHWMRTLGRRVKFRKMMSRSVSNLSELREEDEEELARKARMDMLKFPSDFNINSTYYELEGAADDVIKNINELIKVGQRAKSPNNLPAHGRRLAEHRQLSLSEPNLSMGGEGGEEEAESQLLPWQLSPRGPSQRSNVMGLRPESMTSQSSAGTLVKGTDAQQMSETFDMLEEDLWRGEGREEEEEGEGVMLSLPPRLRDRLQQPYEIPMDGNPLGGRRSAAETEAIFDEILTQLNDASSDLEHFDGGHISRVRGSKKRSSVEGVSTEGANRDSTEGANRDSFGGSNRDSTEGANRSSTEGVNRSSTEGVNPDSTGGTSIEGDQEKISDTNPSVAVTLRSPRHRDVQVNMDSPTKPRSSSVTVMRKSATPEPRKMSLPEGSFPPLLGASSSDTVPASTSSSSMSLDILRNLSTLPGRPHPSTDAGTTVDPTTKALKLMVCMSQNRECLTTLVSYLCLPKFMAQLTNLAQSPTTPPKALGYIAALMNNIFEAGGTEGRKTALGSGFLDLVIKLLHTRDPIPGTCLTLLNSLLVTEEDNDHLHKIIRIPSEPLLMYLEPLEMAGSEFDSGIDSRHLSRTTPSGSDNQVNASDDASSRPSSELGTVYLEVPPPGKFRAASFNSETSESSSARSLASPTPKGPSISLLEARRIVLKMLSVSSSHHKMQHELAKPHSIALLISCLGDASQENIVNATITLANVAQNVDSHTLLQQAGLVAKLRELLDNGPRQRYHASRGLVYMGELDLGNVSIFDENASSYEADTVLLSTDDDGHSYARGATIEKCVEFLTGETAQLWGGFSLIMGPQLHSNGITKKATKEQIINFFLTTFRSFMHPLVFMRLLLHKLATPCSQNPFDWSVQPDKSSITPTPHASSIPPHQMSSLNVIGHWLEHYPEDFLCHAQLQEEVTRIVQRLKLARGPYTPHCHRLRSLQQDVSRPHSSGMATKESMEKRVPHHNNLYKLNKQMVTSGLLPVTLEQAVYLTALQMHIEMVAEPSPFINQSRTSATPTHAKKSFTGKLKSTLPAGYNKSKSLMKRIKTQMQEVEVISERNSKHLFIEKCQSLPGYDCTFFSVRVPSAARFRKGAHTKQLLGISSTKVVFLDEKTKLVTSYYLEQVKGIDTEGDPCSLSLSLAEGVPVRFNVETVSLGWEIKNILERGKEGGEWQPPDEGVRWSDSLSALPTTISNTQLDPAPSSSPSSSSSSSPSNENTESRETTPSPLSANGTAPRDALKVPTPNFTPHSSPLHLHSIKPNGHLETNQVSVLLTRDDSFGNDLSEQAMDENAPFCDCPPDPEIPRHMKLHHLSLREILECPLETARQVTLIAHEHFQQVTSVELLQKVHLIPKHTRHPHTPKPHHTHQNSTSLPLSEQHLETGIERLAFQFNQVGNWVASSVLTFDDIEERVNALEQFILISKHCLDLRNYSTLMAIIVAGLGSAPIRRLHRTWEGVSKTSLEMFHEMDALLGSRSNYKNYRDTLSLAPVPAVPYIGVFLKDLTFICDGNPDYIRGGLINLHKRRQVYQKLEEIKHFQQEGYNYHTVPEFHDYLLGYHPIAEEDLHCKSHALEPRIRRSHSQGSNRGKSTSSGGSASNFFRVLTRSGSSSSTNLHRTS